MADLEERLRSHSRAISQLLSLIPAKHYFSASDNSVQWNKRKQTKEESQRAKKAKLDPDSIISAADMKLQKKLEEIEGELDVKEGIDHGEEQMKEPMTKRNKKNNRESTAGVDVKKVTKSQSGYTTLGKGEELEAEDDREMQIDGFSFSTQLTASPPPATSLNSTKTSNSPPTISAEQRADQRARLAARIEALRVKRRADSPDGTPARNRHELMAARRREEAIQRKERKKGFRAQQKVTAEQTKSVALPPKQNPAPKKKEKHSQSQANGEASPVNEYMNTGSGRDIKGKLPKKSSSKKSRPGFEGSLKSNKGKK